mgnify:CR=1 FL=1
MSSGSGTIALRKKDMNKFLKVVLILLALLGACFILLLSVVSSVLSLSSNPSVFQRTFYSDEQILPDHISYPVLMVLDRVRLEVATPIERVYLQTEYANRRLIYAQALLEKGNADLALTTLTKGQKYLLYAAIAVNDHNEVPRLKNHVIKTIQYHVRSIQATLDSDTAIFSDSQRASVNSLNEELLVVLSQLQSGSEPTPAASEPNPSEPATSKPVMSAPLMSEPVTNVTAK